MWSHDISDVAIRARRLTLDAQGALTPGTVLTIRRGNSIVGNSIR